MFFGVGLINGPAPCAALVTILPCAQLLKCYGYLTFLQHLVRNSQSHVQHQLLWRCA